MNPQISLFTDSPAGPAPAVNDPDSFGCCSRYRECSDSGQCLIVDREYSAYCSYRKQLEGGRVFYGKNATGFDPNRYAEILQRAKSLPTAIRKIFDRIVIDLCEYNRGACRCIVRNEHIARLASVGLFEFHPLGSAFTGLCSYNLFLLPIFKDSPLFINAQTDQKENRLYPGKSFAGRKELLLYWLDNDAPALRDLLADPYRFAVLKPECALYAEELYRDTLLTGYDERIYPRSPLSEDGLLSPAVFVEEETRRVRLSRGYSPKEKEEHITAAQQSGKCDNQDEKSVDNSGAPANSFSGLKFVITGVLAKMERREAFVEILLRGGSISDNPVNTMDYLVLGYQEWSELNGGVASRKVQKAVDLQKSGKNVHIISEDEFYSMLGRFLYAH